jgi:hypothetical protein
MMMQSTLEVRAQSDGAASVEPVAREAREARVVAPLPHLPLDASVARAQPAVAPLSAPPFKKADSELSL